MPKLKDPNVWFQNALKVTEDSATSGWLKNALLEAINRDPVDAAGDAVCYLRQLQFLPPDCRSRESGLILKCGRWWRWKYHSTVRPSGSNGFQFKDNQVSDR